MDILILISILIAVLIVHTLLTLGLYAGIMFFIKRYGATRDLWPWPLKALVIIFVVFFDTPLNWVTVTLWYQELPREFLFTTRLKRWRKKLGRKNYHDLSSRQKKMRRDADYICDEHLDYYDMITGDHC